MSRLLAALRMGVICVLAMLLSANVYFIGARLIADVENPKLFGFSHSIVLSGSMEPIFSAGDLLVYREQDDYGVGDVVIFTQGGSFVTHRIVDETDAGFITRGDANNTPDTQPLAPENIHGKMVLIVPEVGSFLLFLRTPFGFLILLLTGFLFMEIPNILHLLKRKKGKYEA